VLFCADKMTTHMETLTSKGNGQAFIVRTGAYQQFIWNPKQSRESVISEC
jgi:hypothetical protein